MVILHSTIFFSYHCDEMKNEDRAVLKNRVIVNVIEELLYICLMTYFHSLFTWNY